jgi:hypothetical protein
MRPEQALPGKVVNVILFGSRARGDARRNSDYDVAVVIWGLDDRRSIDHALADMAYRHNFNGLPYQTRRGAYLSCATRPASSLILGAGRRVCARVPPPVVHDRSFPCCDD